MAVSKSALKILGISVVPKPVWSCNALVLVNSASTGYQDYVEFLKPRMDSLGLPYGTLDIATTPVPAEVGICEVIIVGHRRLDVGP